MKYSFKQKEVLYHKNNSGMCKSNELLCIILFHFTMNFSQQFKISLKTIFFLAVQYVILLYLIINQNYIFHLIIVTLSLKFQEYFAEVVCLSMHDCIYNSASHKWDNMIHIKNNFKAFLWFLLLWKYCLLMNSNETILYTLCEKLPRGVNQLLWQKSWVWKNHFSHEERVWKSRMKKSLGKKKF